MTRATEAERPMGLDIRPYRIKYDGVRHKITPAEPIPDDIPVSICRTGRFDPRSFTLNEPDYMPVGRVPNPGKSAHVAFTQDTEEFSHGVFGLPALEGFVVVSFLPHELREVGFVAVHAPLRTRPLHVRVVHQIHWEDPANINNIPERSKIDLAKMLQRNLIQRAV